MMSLAGLASAEFLVKDMVDVLAEVPSTWNAGVIAPSKNDLEAPPIWSVGIATVPVKVGLARGAFKSKAAWVAVDTGLLASEVLSRLDNPTADLSRVCQLLGGRDQWSSVT
jgi:hypothetical protein